MVESATQLWILQESCCSVESAGGGAAGSAAGTGPGGDATGAGLGTNPGEPAGVVPVGPVITGGSCRDTAVEHRIHGISWSIVLIICEFIASRAWVTVTIDTHIILYDNIGRQYNSNNSLPPYAVLEPCRTHPSRQIKALKESVVSNKPVWPVWLQNFIKS